MQYTVSRGEKGKVEIKVDVTKTEFLAAFDDALEALGKDAKISGFRPGKIPKDVLENNIGLTKILNETASFLVSKNLSEIFKKENVVPVNSPSIAVQSLAKDSPFSFTATLISKPQVKIGDWKKIKVKKVKAHEVTGKDVEKSIKNIYEAYQKQKETNGTKEPEEPNEEKSKKFIYDAHGNKIFLKDETKGTNESKEPMVDDEFAKQIGARDLAHLRDLVKQDLEKIITGQVEAKLEQELFDEMLKIAKVDVPDILIDDELNRIIVRITQNLEQQNKKLDDYLREENTTLDALRAKLRPQAEKNVKITLIMDDIGKAEKVQVTHEEIENAAKGVDDAKLDDKQKADLRNYLAVSLFQAKTLEYIKKAVAS